MKITIVRIVAMKRLIDGACRLLEHYCTLCGSRVKVELAKRDLLELQAREVKERIAATAELYEHAKRLGEFFVTALVEGQDKPN